MPHLIMEYSNSSEERLNMQGLLEDLHQVAIDSELFSVNDVKSRAIRVHSWLVGDQENNADFIHITLELLSGRTAEQKRQLSRRLMDVLAEQANHIDSLTINVRDMEPESFQKIG
ncbi:5-carboxymethyl-2-hydroxymuconate Delta-isomerase [Aliivibrio finisterrensis]|uniref:5-carboxymethyl-2-hydroxymuconate Delta-isomerase n=1 Tax=Aliivibrio finisterrensis TaxID=511998 RepID=A0A6N6RP47_9GAMM|nr:5-carboxymethyl-2-hydroxymuconate Delta-isomerase [Aliivibrio finisterrensis]KAB2823215.1 5-carboxymethyl-2-hydroxymuconate Delta-isomerase [Aliivibrio finisterrensis]